MAVDESQQVDNLLPGDEVFGEEIRGVDVSLDLPQFNRGILYPLLNPQGAGINVAQLSKPCAATCTNPEVNLPSQIFHGGLISQCNAVGFRNTIEFCFSAAEANNSLRRTP